MLIPTNVLNWKFHLVFLEICKIKKPHTNEAFIFVVAGTGLEPATFGL